MNLQSACLNTVFIYLLLGRYTMRNEVVHPQNKHLFVYCHKLYGFINRQVKLSFLMIVKYFRPQLSSRETLALVGIVSLLSAAASLFLL